ncbi:hypothetical protein TNCV_1947111 [Trichonephila clavipes]|nr:hypothetical protein TNCV_1947111 [Trichonephila clavipes]
MTDICHYAQEGTKPQLLMNSGAPSLQALKVWFQQCVKGFMNGVCMRGDHPFASLSRHIIDRNVAVGMSACPLDE